MIGDTVNTASRLQSLTRGLATPLVAGGPLVEAVRADPRDDGAALLARLEDHGEQALRGRAAAVRVWSRRGS